MRRALALNSPSSLVEGSLNMDGCIHRNPVHHSDIIHGILRFYLVYNRFLIDDLLRLGCSFCSLLPSAAGCDNALHEEDQRERLGRGHSYDEPQAGRAPGETARTAVRFLHGGLDGGDDRRACGTTELSRCGEDGPDCGCDVGRSHREECDTERRWESEVRSSRSWRDRHLLRCTVYDGRSGRTEAEARESERPVVRCRASEDK